MTTEEKEPQLLLPRKSKKQCVSVFVKKFTTEEKEPNFYSLGKVRDSETHGCLSVYATPTNRPSVPLSFQLYQIVGKTGNTHSSMLY